MPDCLQVGRGFVPAALKAGVADAEATDMTEPAVAPGWYPDPWNQAELRWHDGSAWTSNLHGEAAAAPSATVTTLPGVVAGTDRSSSGKAIAALVLGLLGVPLVALVLGILALRDIGRSAGRLTGRWMAITGIVLNALQLLLLPIILAVAIPTFLAQKEIAGSTVAKADVKNVVNAVESCATVNVDGSYSGCGDAAALAEIEPVLADVLQDCGSAGGVCVELTADEMGYTVRAVDRGSPSTTYVESHGSDGAIQKTCSGPRCPGGKW